jgi:hypothetical protein
MYANSVTVGDITAGAAKAANTTTIVVGTTTYSVIISRAGAKPTTSVVGYAPYET